MQQLKLLLIEFLLIKENYNKYRKYIKLNYKNKDEFELYKALDSAHYLFDRDILWDEFKVLNIEYADVLSKIEELNNNIGKDIYLIKLNELIEKENAYNLSLLSLDVYEGKKSFNNIITYINNYDSHKENLIDEKGFISDDFEELYSLSVSRQGLRWKLKSLNESFGSLRKGDFGFIFARPETGKTTWLASQITFFASQITGPIIWFNNEEQGNKVMLRCYQAALGMSLTELLHAGRSHVTRLFHESTRRNIKIVDSATIYKEQVQSYCEELQPGLVIFDQLDKLQGFSADREDLRLGSIYTWARELAKRYCPIIGVCQASAEAEGRKYLTMDMIADSKTSKAAEADWILGIGKSHAEGMEYQRYFSICKNKLIGDEDTLPEFRHNKWEVCIKPSIAQYEDIH